MAQSSKLDQVINFLPITDKTCADTVFAVGGIADSGLPVEVSVVSGPATISNNILTISKVNFTQTSVQTSVVLKASQPGNAAYNAASDEFLSFQVKTNYWENLNNRPILANLDTAVNEGSELRLEATPVSGLTYKWTTPISLVIDGPSVVFQKAVTSMSGIYSLKISEGKCQLFASSFSVKVYPKPLDQAITFLPIPTKTCKDSVFKLNATATSGLPVSFVSNGENTTIFQDSVRIGAVILSGHKNQFVFTVTSTQIGNRSYNAAPTVSRPVVIKSDFWEALGNKPIIKTLESTVLEGGSIMLEAQSVPGIKYIWSLSDNTTLSNHKLTLNNASPSFNGTYRLIINDGICLLLDTSFNIKVLKAEKAEIKIYTIVTPNDDKKNDVFFVENILFFPDNELTITDLWGNTVQYFKNYSNTWSPENINAGEYYYDLIINLTGKRYAGGFLVLK